MKKLRFFSALLAALLLFSATPAVYSSDDTLPFRDVPENKWFCGAVKAVYEAGIMNGITENEFRPNDPMTRGQFVAIIARVSGEDVSGMTAEAKFSDTAKKRFYSDALGWCVKNGLINGYPDGTFGPNRPILRQEFAAVFVRYLDYKKLTIEGDDVADSFADSAKFPKFAKEAIEALRLTGLVKGDKAGNFNPKANMTRAEIAQVIARLLPYIKGVEMVKDGMTDYVVVCAPGAEQAAERVQWQIKTQTGAEIAVVTDGAPAQEREIVLGETNRSGGIDPAGLGEDGYEIKTEGEKYFIGGETPEGIYRGVTALLKSGKANGTSFNLPETPDVRVPFEYPVGKLTINGRDIAEYVIIYPEDASPSVMTGVNDLVKYIEKACGVRLETTTAARTAPAIVVDQTPVAIEGSYNFNEENFSIQSEGDNIIIKGSPVRGAMYGCYGFLEKCVGWYFLTPEVDYLEKAETVDIKDVDIVYSPYFEYRCNYWRGAMNSDAYSAKQQLNGNTRSETYGGGIGYTGGAVHTLQNLTNGEYDQSTQPCFNDEEIYSTVLGNVMTLLENNPDARIISVSQNDNTNACQCETCQAVREEEGSEAGNVVRFVNRIADDVRAAGYDKVAIHTLAYAHTVEVCKTKPRDNVLIQYCTAENCFNHPIDTKDRCGHKEDVPHEQYLTDWSGICSRIWVWDYGTHFTNYLNPTANYRYSVLCGNIRFFYEHGVSGLFNQGAYTSSARTGEFSEMRNFLLAEIMKDPYMTEERYYELMDLFLRGYYGADAAPYIREFIDLILTDDHDDTWGQYGGTEEFSKSLRFRKHLDRMTELFRNAGLATDTYYQWECADVDSVQKDFLVLTLKFNTEYNKADEEGKAAIREEGFTMAQKMKKYGLSISEGIRSPKFDSPDQVIFPPSRWKILVGSDGIPLPPDEIEY